MHCKSYSHFFSKKFQHICVSVDVNFNESLTNDIVSFEQLGPVRPGNMTALHSFVSGKTLEWWEGEEEEEGGGGCGGA